MPGLVDVFGTETFASARKKCPVPVNVRLTGRLFCTSRAEAFDTPNSIIIIGAVLSALRVLKCSRVVSPEVLARALARAGSSPIIARARVPHVNIIQIS